MSLAHHVEPLKFIVEIRHLVLKHSKKGSYMCCPRGIKYLVLIFISLALQGCGKPKIESNCVIQGNGGAHCTFHNKGDGKGSRCEIAVLTEIFSDKWGMQESLELALVLDEFSKSGKLGINQKIKDAVVKAAISKKTYENFGEKHTEAEIFEELRSELKLSKLEFEKFHEIRQQAWRIIDSLPENQSIHHSTNEICSGIVEANDVREIHTQVSFNGLSPMSICSRWPNDCVFSTKESSPENKIAPTPITVEKRIQLATEAARDYISKL